MSRPDAGEPAGLAVLRGWADYRRLWLSQLASSTGTQASALAYPLLAISVSRSALAAGVIPTVLILGRVLTRLPGGYLADRWRRRRCMQLGDGLRLATSLTVTLVAAVASVPLWLLALCALVDGVGYGLFRPAEVAAIPHIVPRELIPRAVAANETREFSASLAGPVLGGLLFGVTPALPFGFDALSYIVSLVLVSRIRSELQADDDRARVSRPGLFAGLRWLVGRPATLMSFAVLGILGFIAGGAEFAAILFVRRAGNPSWATGGVLAMAAVGGLIGSLAAPRLTRALSQRVLLTGVAVLWCVFVPVLAAGHQPALVGAAMFVLVAAVPVANTAVMSGVVATTDSAILGSATSSGSFLATGLQPLGPVVVGALAGGLRPLGVTAVMAAFALVAACLGPFTAVRHRAVAQQ